jgi:regulator of sigma D
MQETAVSWLEKEFVKLEQTIGVHGKMYELLEQAKEMFDKQVMDAWNEGHFEIFGCIDAEHYYNETFKSE